MQYKCTTCGSKSWTLHFYVTPRCNLCGKEICGNCSQIRVCHDCGQEFFRRSIELKVLFILINVIRFGGFGTLAFLTFPRIWQGDPIYFFLVIGAFFGLSLIWFLIKFFYRSWLIKVEGDPDRKESKGS